MDGVTTKFLYDGDQIIAEYDGSDSMTAKYVYGASIDEPIEKIGAVPEGGLSHFFYHYDGLGSVINLTDSTGATVGAYSYDVFGTPSAISAVGNRCMFTGREYDAETGLYYYRARCYAPNIGRFLQRDPIGYPMGMNLYWYCENSPINFVDPLGLWVEMGNRIAVNASGVKGYHTVIIIHPDNPADFENDPNLKERFYRNANGELEATLSANPDRRPNENSPFGDLKATPNDSNDRPYKLGHRQKISDKRCDTQLIKDIFSSADKYKNNFPYDPTPLPTTGWYNSNSYAYGVLRNASVKSIPNLKGWEPGADAPIPSNN